MGNVKLTYVYMMCYFHLFRCYAVSSVFLTNPHWNWECDKSNSFYRRSKTAKLGGSYTSASCKGGKSCNFGALRVNKFDFLWRTTRFSLISVTGRSGRWSRMQKLWDPITATFGLMRNSFGFWRDLAIVHTRQCVTV